MRFQPDWTIQQVALEVARVAYEGLGHTKLERLRITFDQQVKHTSADQEMQLRVVTRILITLTDRRPGPQDTTATPIAGLCLMWLAQTRVRDWTLLQLYNWMLPFLSLVTFVCLGLWFSSALVANGQNLWLLRAKGLAIQVSL